MSARFVWFDVTTSKPEAVRAFYEDLLTWPTAPEDSAGPYKGWFMDDAQPWAGVVEATEATAGRWIPYVQVHDLDAAATRAEQLGATIITERTEGPAGSSIVVADPGGALVALWIPRAGEAAADSSS